MGKKKNIQPLLKKDKGKAFAQKIHHGFINTSA